MEKTITYKSSKCQHCGCYIIVRKRKGIKASLLRALAVADHLKTSHRDLFNRACGIVA